MQINLFHSQQLKNPKIARQNPQIPSWPQIPKILGKIPSSGSAVLIAVLLVRCQVSKQYAIIVTQLINGYCSAEKLKHFFSQLAAYKDRFP